MADEAQPGSRPRDKVWGAPRLLTAIANGHGCIFEFDPFCRPTVHTPVLYHKGCPLLYDSSHRRKSYITPSYKDSTAVLCTLYCTLNLSSQFAGNSSNSLR